MKKLEITVLVPEEIAALVQHFIQHNLCGEGNPDFKDYLEMSGIKKPNKYVSEMEIGIKHPDDEPVKITDFDHKKHREISSWLLRRKLYSYMDMVLDEHLYSIDCIDEINVDPPQIVLDFIESVKATGCSYFMFVNN